MSTNVTYFFEKPEITFLFCLTSVSKLRLIGQSKNTYGSHWGFPMGTQFDKSWRMFVVTFLQFEFLSNCSSFKFAHYTSQGQGQCFLLV